LSASWRVTFAAWARGLEPVLDAELTGQLAHLRALARAHQRDADPAAAGASCSTDAMDV